MTTSSSSTRLQDKVCIVTGASSGIGRAIALEYVKHGAKGVVCADLVPGARGDEKAVNTHDLINQEYSHSGDQGKKAIFVKTDVTNVEDVENLVKRAVKEFGRVDVLVNNAGGSVESRREPLRLHETSDEDWKKTMDVNLRSVFLCCKYTIAQMLTQEPDAAGDRGWIINMSSIYGLVGGRNAVSYTASKGAVTNMTRSIALEYAPEGIHCNAINPGFTRTQLLQDTIANIPIEMLEAAHPLKGLGKPEDIASVAVFLASAEASWVTGINLPVDGGYTIQ